MKYVVLTAKHCDGFSIGSNDLTQLVLGVDRDSEMLGKMGLFDERNAAVVKAIKMIIEGAHKQGVTVSLCGQAPSNYPDFARVLVEAGIDSISVNPDAVGKVKQVVLQVEKELGIVAPPKPAEPAPPTEAVAVPEAAPPAEEAQAPAAVQTTLAPAAPPEPDVCPKCYKPRAQCTCNKGFKVFGLKIL
jgi:hypothetical protein